MRSSTRFMIAAALAADVALSSTFLSAQTPNPVPDFTVSTIDGSKTFALSKARGKYVALHFLLKTECPICLKHTRDYAQKSGTLPQVEQVFLKPDPDPGVKAMEAKLAATTGIVAPAIYQDKDAQLAEKLAVPGGYQFHGETVHYPALVLIAPDGREVFRYVGKNNQDRFSFEQLQAKIAELGAAPAGSSAGATTPTASAAPAPPSR